MFALGLELPRAESIRLSVIGVLQPQAAPETLPCTIGRGAGRLQGAPDLPRGAHRILWCAAVLCGIRAGRAMVAGCESADGAAPDA